MSLDGAEQFVRTRPHCLGLFSEEVRAGFRLLRNERTTALNSLTSCRPCRAEMRGRSKRSASARTAPLTALPAWTRS